jgi:hypothetical protein
VSSVGGECGAAAGVDERAVLKHADGGFGRVQAAAAAAQHGRTRLERLFG